MTSKDYWTGFVPVGNGKRAKSWNSETIFPGLENSWKII
jgi:hypothetical protein